MQDIISGGQTWLSNADNLQLSLIGIVLFLVSLLGCCVLVYCSEMYKLFPGWGPIVRYDADGSEDLMQRQKLLLRSYAASNSITSGHSDHNAKCEGYITNHPIYGSVMMRPNFVEVMNQRRADPSYARDEPHFRDQGSSSYAPAYDAYEGTTQRMV